MDKGTATAVKECKGDKVSGQQVLPLCLFRENVRIPGWFSKTMSSIVTGFCENLLFFMALVLQV
jgi:hypothetical protein